VGWWRPDEAVIGWYYYFKKAKAALFITTTPVDGRHIDECRVNNHRYKRKALAMDENQRPYFMQVVQPYVTQEGKLY
jgi:hypothetical protein